MTRTTNLITDPALAEAMAYLAEHVRHRPPSGLSRLALANDRPWADRYFELTNDVLKARMDVEAAGVR